MQKMQVQKRGARGYEEVKFDKITARIQHLCKDLSAINYIQIAQATILSIYDGITTEELDRISANKAETMKLKHPQYSTIAARILISNLHKTTPKRFSESIKLISKKLDAIAPEFLDFICQNAESLDSMIIDANDYSYEYFGFRTMEHGYLHKYEEPVTDTIGEPIWIDNDGEIIDTGLIFKTKRGASAYKDPNGKTQILRMKTRPRVIDRPQYILMRAAIASTIGKFEVAGLLGELKNSTRLHSTIEEIRMTYKCLSQMYYTFATPTLFNSCGRSQNLSSCYLLGTGDAIEDIMHTISSAALISKWAGGEGIHMSNIRSRGRWIKGTNGKSSGLVPQLKMYNETACTFDQGGKRKGAFAIYIEPWHGDIMKILRMKLNAGAESERARDLFYALWIPDLIMNRFINDVDISLFSEDVAHGLSEVYDGMMVCTKCDYCANPAYAKYGADSRPIPFDKSIVIDGTQMKPTADQAQCPHDFQPTDVFSKLYREYEEEGLAVDYVSAKDLLDAIIFAQREAGTPYILFKDNVNRMSNQEGIGTIKSSNLCCEIVEWSNDKSYACCTLSSINLRRFLIPGDNPATNNLAIDYEKLADVARLIVRKLDKIITNNDYPVPECVGNSHDFRPIGIGIQAEADVYAMMRIPFAGPIADRISIEIMETIYFAAVSESCELAKKYGPFKGFEWSPAARGELAPDLWMRNQARIKSIYAGQNPYEWNHGPNRSANMPINDFDSLKLDVKTNGMRNSLLISPMPTVTTSQILGNNESFEPFQSNLFTKDTIGGKYTIVNKYMVSHLTELGFWNEILANDLMNTNGSLLNLSNLTETAKARIEKIPLEVRQIYATVWEISQYALMCRSARRQAFVDQSQSLNIYLSTDSTKAYKSSLMAGYALGLKTGSYYIRANQTNSAMKNNIAITRELDRQEPKPEPSPECKMDEGCTFCSS